MCPVILLLCVENWQRFELRGDFQKDEIVIKFPDATAQVSKLRNNSVLYFSSNSSFKPYSGDTIFSAQCFSVTLEESKNE